jgi:hypothetical protein
MTACGHNSDLPTRLLFGRFRGQSGKASGLPNAIYEYTPHRAVVAETPATALAARPEPWLSRRRSKRLSFLSGRTPASHPTGIPAHPQTVQAVARAHQMSLAHVVVAFTRNLP